MKISGHNIEISKPDKLMYPESGITKQMVADYYIKIAPKMLPYIEDRPLTMQRYPHGIKQEGFYQKDVDGDFPGWIKTVKVPLIKGGKIDMVIAEDEATLAYLAHLYTLTIHTSLSRAGSLKNPDYMVFDLDPSDDDFSKVVEVADILHGVLLHANYKPWLMTTGSRGLHIIAPLNHKMSFDDSRHEAKLLAEKVHSKAQDISTLEIRKEHRGEKVYIDILRNAYGQTHIAPYSLRDKEGAPIAMPISWHELHDSSLTPTKYKLADFI